MSVLLLMNVIIYIQLLVNTSEGRNLNTKLTCDNGTGWLVGSLPKSDKITHVWCTFQKLNLYLAPFMNDRNVGNLHSFLIKSPFYNFELRND